MASSEPVVRYRSLEEGTREEFLRVRELSDAFKSEQPKRLLAALEELRGSFTGELVDRYTHSLQTATRALRAGEGSELVVAAVFHDIGDMLAGANHGAFAAAILAPYVSEGTRWMVEHHPEFQGYYFWHHFGKDRFVREKYRGHPHFDLTVRFCQWDQAAFDPDYDTLPISAFEPMVYEIFSREPWGPHTGAGSEAGPVSARARAAE